LAISISSAFDRISHFFSAFAGSVEEASIMAISVKSISLWRRELQDRPGALAESLTPLAGAGVSVKVLMAYRYPGDPTKAAVEVYPISGKRASTAAQQASLSPAAIPALLVEGDDAPGLGHRMSRAVADAGINLDFVMAQVIGRKYSAVFGFANEADASRAASLIKKSAARPRTARGRKRR
jgi:hypothetical protein